jgi:hypothetical protein
MMYSVVARVLPFSRRLQSRCTSIGTAASPIPDFRYLFDSFLLVGRIIEPNPPVLMVIDDLGGHESGFGLDFAPSGFTLDKGIDALERFLEVKAGRLLESHLGFRTTKGTRFEFDIHHWRLPAKIVKITAQIRQCIPL